jgi:hypothetical protein
MQRIQKALGWAILASETSHVFCCVLPTLAGLFSLLSGLGVIGVLPAGIMEFHHIMHRWEIPMIVASGVILALGWVLYVISQRIDCHDTGCIHGACAPKKNRTAKILKIATVLFVVNTSIWLSFHAGY